ncbi:MAG: glycine zipper 2TM domain-containing protein [Pseudomonadota bacterium]|jgi:outer membrane lipoprotein SlyB
MKQTLFLVVAGIMSIFGMSAYAQQNTPSADVYGRGNSMVMGNVYQGTVIDVRQVHIEASNTAAWTGRGAGTALGAMIGSKVGKGNGRVAAGILGGVLGAVAGDMVADKVGGSEGTEIVVAMTNGRTVAITQAGETAFVPGAPVYVIQSGGTVRIVPRHAAEGASSPMVNGASRPAAHQRYARYAM